MKRAQNTPKPLFCRFSSSVLFKILILFSNVYFYYSTLLCGLQAFFAFFCFYDKLFIIILITAACAANKFEWQHHTEFNQSISLLGRAFCENRCQRCPCMKIYRDIHTMVCTDTTGASTVTLRRKPLEAKQSRIIHHNPSPSLFYLIPYKHEVYKQLKKDL